MSRRGPLALAVLAIFACYAVHMDETQIVTIASQDMDCDKELVSLEVSSTSKKDVARYVARGCEKVRTYECVTDEGGHVSCDSVFKKSGSDTASNDETAGQVVGAAAAGCACASLFGSHSSDPPSSTPASNPNTTTPQRNR